LKKPTVQRFEGKHSNQVANATWAPEFMTLRVAETMSAAWSNKV